MNELLNGGGVNVNVHVNHGEEDTFIIGKEYNMIMKF